MLSAAAGVRAAPRVTMLDDGEKIARDVSRPLPPSAWPSTIELFALREETLAFQVVVDAEDEPIDGLHVTFAEGLPPEVRVETFAERFVEIVRPTANDRDHTSIAFRAKAAPAPGAFIGFFADALVPGAEARAERGQRAATWIDLYVGNAAPGVHRTEVKVFAGSRLLEARPVIVRIAEGVLPYPGARITTFYDRSTLQKRMGSLDAEPALRRMLHAHRLSAIRELTREEDVAAEADALSGKLYVGGPGQGVGEGVFAIGAYGALGEPDPGKVDEVSKMDARLQGVAPGTPAFLYAVDEDCESPRAEHWLRHMPAGLRVGVTCSEDPGGQAANLVMMTSDRYDPDEVLAARAKGKWVWIYNGQRPFAGAPVLDVPATDLRANGWIAARYGIERWFYWEATFWMDDNRGGKGGPSGFDPFTVAETFHNERGDHANGDGILVYPGAQVVPGMVNDGARGAVYPSVRLKNLRRGAEDAGYIELARAVDPALTADILERMVPNAVRDAKKTPSWPERGLPWLSARRELLQVIERSHPPLSPRREKSRTLVLIFVASVTALVTFVASRLKRVRAGVRPKGPRA
jgi:hypothetical protein